MKVIKTKSEYDQLSQVVFDIMNKGAKNLTIEEQKKVRSIALGIQDYESRLYPIKMPRTLGGMIELKMYEKKLTQANLAKKLDVNTAKLSLILNGKQKPDISFLKKIRKVLGIDADFILDHA